MRKVMVLMVVLALLAVPVASVAEELRIFTWSEYMDEEKMPADFEAKYGIKVRLDIYENNEEMVAKLQAGGVSQYDIIVPSDYIMPVLINQKLIQPLDHAKLPNLDNLKPLFRETSYDPGNKYSVAYQWGTVGLMYRRDKVSDEAVTPMCSSTPAARPASTSAVVHPKSGTAGNSGGAKWWLAPSRRTAPVVTMTSPGSMWGWIAPVVPTLRNVVTPSCASSSTAIDVDGPPIPVEQTMTSAPPTVPRIDVNSRFDASGTGSSSNSAMCATRPGSPGMMANVAPATSPLVNPR